VDLQLYLLS